MLLDFSDVLQIDVFTLGRAYLKLAQELYINLPAVDPCLYIHRFAHKLEFGEKEHDVAMTALRLVSRMKRDWIHHGRRPSGLCGAALLVAARLHGFNRTVREVVKTVRISDTTIRKRLGDFRDTPSSQLTIDEFQKIDLEEEQDPPSFTQARKRAKQQLDEINKPEIASELEAFQNSIEKILGINSQKDKPVTAEENGHAEESNRTSEKDDTRDVNSGSSALVIPPFSIADMTSKSDNTEDKTEEDEESEELDLTGLDDDELDKCLLNENEIEIKTKLWMEENKEYLQKQKEKEEKEARDREEGNNQEPKKKRKPYKKKVPTGPASTAGEAIEKMLVEKKISSKINYEVLRDLETSQSSRPKAPVNPVSEPVKQPKQEFLTPRVPTRTGGRKRDSSTPAASPLDKKPKLVQSDKPAKDKVERVHKEVVIESGPVEYEKTDETTPVGEEDEFDELEEEDEEPVSAVHLMGHLYDANLDDEYGDFEDFE
ncbi:transcription factor TFIIIB subunit brf1 [Desmophyllum pertusum]|uniref:Transcription factor TFIIIB subunit brf1 n=1 Tax=Desmophyllum pertusum TaxID=174260 RepID=A0A9W9YB26_9CNID|nr:transcription factor TFIIIB subunit brf1 [Desmophyllum pertusum]